MGKDDATATGFNAPPPRRVGVYVFIYIYVLFGDPEMIDPSESCKRESHDINSAPWFKLLLFSFPIVSLYSRFADSQHVTHTHIDCVSVCTVHTKTFMWYDEALSPCRRVMTGIRGEGPAVEFPSRGKTTKPDDNSSRTVVCTDRGGGKRKEVNKFLADKFSW